MKPQGLGGFNYCLTVIDGATMYNWVLFLIEKGEAGRKLHDFVRWLENQSGKSVKVIVRDGGKEYSPTEEKRFAREKGIQNNTKFLAVFPFHLRGQDVVIPSLRQLRGSVIH
jgi:hypothetical protein